MGFHGGVSPNAGVHGFYVKDMDINALIVKLALSHP